MHHARGRCISLRDLRSCLTTSETPVLGLQPISSYRRGGLWFAPPAAAAAFRRGVLSTYDHRHAIACLNYTHLRLHVHLETSPVCVLASLSLSLSLYLSRSLFVQIQLLPTLSLSHHTSCTPTAVHARAVLVAVAAAAGAFRLLPIPEHPTHMHVCMFVYIRIHTIAHTHTHTPYIMTYTMHTVAVQRRNGMTAPTCALCPRAPLCDPARNAAKRKAAGDKAQLRVGDGMLEACNNSAALQAIKQVVPCRIVKSVADACKPPRGCHLSCQSCRAPGTHLHMHPT